MTADQNIVDLDAAARQLGALVARITDDELALPTPCPAYTVGDLVDHVGRLAVALAGVGRKDPASGEAAGAGDAASLAEDWRDAIPRDLDTLVGVWRDPTSWDGMTRIAGQDAPAASVGLVVADELVVHGWDVARATDQPFDADPAVLDAALRFPTAFASPDAPAGPEVAFGPARPVPADATPLGRVLLLAGRDLEWRRNG
jgi:uncharacterized protein (TIGR03086 family)